MNDIVRYLSHPQVVIDPAKPVGQWSLNADGAARAAAAARAPGLHRTVRIVSSAEVKAVETARPVAEALDLRVEIRPDTHENDRSATGFLPPAEFEEVADAFFADPGRSVRGWETANAAQARMLRELEVILDDPAPGDILMVGHGAVGTLLYCALAGLPIDRRHDQPAGGGNFFAFTRASRRPLHGWRRMERLSDG